MDLSPATISLLSTLDAMSARELRQRADLGTLLELGTRTARHRVLCDLAFYAKFIHRAYRIMTRIGRGAAGYDTLEREFSESMERTTRFIRAILEGAPPDVMTHFTSFYLAVTPEALNNLLALCHDLSWYKNWLIDTERMQRGTA